MSLLELKSSGCWLWPPLQQCLGNRRKSPSCRLNTRPCCSASITENLQVTIKSTTTLDSAVVLYEKFRTSVIDRGILTTALCHFKVSGNHYFNIIMMQWQRSTRTLSRIKLFMTSETPHVVQMDTYHISLGAAAKLCSSRSLFGIFKYNDNPLPKGVSFLILLSLESNWGKQHNRYNSLLHLSYLHVEAVVLCDL